MKIMKHIVDKSIRFTFLILIFFLGLNSYSYAYIDPGTGAFIIQSILAIFGSIIFYLGYPVRIVKNIFNKIFKKKKK